MDLNLTNSLGSQLDLLRQAKVTRAVPQSQAGTKVEETSVPALLPENLPSSKGTHIVSETRSDLGGGSYRLVRVFEREDGRNFIKVEEFSITQQRSSKTITQQNPSGSITRYEEILDRQRNGDFRRTQRLEDSSGEVSTIITPQYKVLNPFILSGGASGYSYDIELPFATYRGTQLDLSA